MIEFEGVDSWISVSPLGLNGKPDEKIQWTLCNVKVARSHHRFQATGPWLTLSEWDDVKKLLLMPIGSHGLVECIEPNFAVALANESLHFTLDLEACPQWVPPPAVFTFEVNHKLRWQAGHRLEHWLNTIKR